MFDQDMRTQISITAKSLNVAPAALMAVAEVESGGRIGARVNGRMEPMIRFEGHYFYRLLPKMLRSIARRQSLAHPKVGRVINPRHQARRWVKLNQAIKINRIAALSSVSWGVGQVMGAHWRWLGYGSVDALVLEARSGLSGQVRLMARFIQKSGLVVKLNSQDWAGFARAYNGPGYKKNRYDEKMAAAFLKHKRFESNKTDTWVGEPFDEFFASRPLLKMRSRGRAVRALQQMLVEQSPGIGVDGKYGRFTRDAVKAFQRHNGLEADGIVGERTWKKLAQITKGLANNNLEKAKKWQPFVRFVDLVIKLFKL